MTALGALEWTGDGVAVVIVDAIAAWFMLLPGALSFAGGHSVPLPNYKGPGPVVAPAELRWAQFRTLTSHWF